MKSARIFAITFLLLAAATVYSQAEDRPYLGAKIPFAFTVGDVELPAGSYQVSLYPLSGTIQIRNRTTGRQAILTTFLASRLEESANSKLVFHRVGRRYFLTQVSEKGSRDYRTLSPGKLERELLRASKMETTTIVAGAAQ